jgi:AcrR family transcriptional regulator
MKSERQLLERKHRKELILKSAIRVFKDRGLESATMDEIAQDAGFGKATLYYYFKSKDEIFNSILLYGWNIVWESIEENIISKKSPKDKFIQVIKKIADLEKALGKAPAYIQEISPVVGAHNGIGVVGIGIMHE